MSLFKIKLPLLAAIAGVACAVGTTAFTKVSNPPDAYTFAYQPNDFQKSSVEKPENWALGSSDCNGQNQACQMTVDESYTHVDPLSQQRVLNTNSSQGSVLDIQTASNDGGQNYFVTNSTDATDIKSKN